jgi:hypothetical protein
VDKGVFIVEMPELDDEAVANIQEFLWEVVRSFESQYFHQLQRHHQLSWFDNK